MCVVKCNESRPACNWPSWIPQTEKSPLSSNEKSKETKPKGKFVGSCYKHGGFFFFIAQTQYIRAFTKRSSFIHFPCFFFSSFLSFQVEMNFSSIFVYLCVSVHGIRRRRIGEELVSMMCRVWWGTDFSSPGFSSVSFPSSMFPQVQSLTERWGRRIERIKE